MVSAFIRLLIASTLALVHVTVFAAVSAQLSESHIDELETVNLTIKITDTRQSQTLDLSALDADFHVMGTNTSSQSRFLNGRGSSWVDYRITLQPKHTGSLKIPSIKVGNEQTPTLELTVRPLSAMTRQIIDEKVFFEQEVSDKTIYVQSQLVLTRRLLYSNGVQLYNDLPGKPEIPNAVVLTLGETISGTIERKGRTYGVVQQRYAIFPETSGEFEIPAITVTASVRLVENGRASRKGVRVGTQQQLIQVLPVPPEYPTDKPWLPAENVRLLAVVTPPRESYEVGETLSHELLIHIEGNIGSAAPPLALPVNENEFRVYPEAPVMEDDTNAGTVNGSRLQTNAIVPQLPGTLEIPSNEITWWDTQAKKVRTTQTQRMVFDITGEAVEPINQQSTQISEAPEVEAETPLEEQESAALEYQPRYIAIGGALLILAIVGIYLFRRLSTNKTSTTNPEQRKYSNKNSHQLLNRAFKEENLTDIVNHASTLLALHFRCSKVDALRQFQIVEPENAATLREISQMLYGSTAPDTNHSAQQTKIRRLRLAIDDLVRPPTTLTKDKLPPLYPNAF